MQFASSEEEDIYKQLSLVPQSLDKLSLDLKINSNILASHLTMLELSSLAYNTGEGWVRN